MKYLLSFCFLCSLIQAAAEENELNKISEQMKEAANLLREDRHDVFVRVKLKEISGKLDSMISEAEKQQQQQNQKQNQNKQQQQKQSRMDSLAQSPKRNSSLGPKTEQGSMQDSAKVAGKSSSWAKLPPALREELMQSFGADIPIRWRKRLEAYFISIAAEETKQR
jgi:hypothetical protein